jgi:hypothetical protein
MLCPSPAQTIPSYFYKIQFNIIWAFTNRSSKFSHLFKFSNQKHLTTFSFSPTRVTDTTDLILIDKTHTCHIMYMSHHIHVSPYTLLTIYMSHHIHVSPYTCLTIYMPYHIHASQYTCLTIYMSHHIHVSPYTCLAIYMSRHIHQAAGNLQVFVLNCSMAFHLHTNCVPRISR